MELVALWERLPPNKRDEVEDFARFLLAQEAEAQWEATLSDPRPRPKLGQFVEAALREGSEPLDLGKL